MLCLAPQAAVPLPLLPEDFSFSPQSRQLATQFTLLLLSLVPPRPRLPRRLMEGVLHTVGYQDVLVTEEEKLRFLGLAAISSLSFHQGTDGQYESLVQLCAGVSGPCGKGAEARESGGE